MKKSRREFLKRSGLATLAAGAAGTGILSGCGDTGNTGNRGSESNSGSAGNTGNTGNSGRSDSRESHTGRSPESGRNWQEDPEWMEVRYGDWAGPGVPARPGPMDHVLLKDFAPRSSLVVPRTHLERARFPVIDVHIHDYPRRAGGDAADRLREWVGTMDRTGVELSVVLTGATGEEFDRMAEFYLRPYPDRFQLWCGLLTDGIDRADYPQRAADELVRCHEAGARGVGELTDKGKGLTRDYDLAADERLHPHDPRLDLFWRTCAELRMPVNLHMADHPSAWEAPDVFQERTPVYQQFNQYGLDILSHDELLAVRDRTLERHPDTTFICCHLSNQGHDLESLGEALERYPNLYLDISARDYEVGRTPRAAKRFLTAWPDRVLFGTDMGMAESMYRSWWRLLESDDEYMTGRIWWMYYGLDLPDELLEPLYRGNARRLLNL